MQKQNLESLQTVGNLLDSIYIIHIQILKSQK